MIPIFNEYQCATYMNNGEANDRSQDDPRLYQFRELVIYAKWLRWSLWANLPEGPEKDTLVYNGFVTFCEQLLSNFNIDVDYKMVLDVLKKSKQIKLRECNPSIITTNEFNQLISLPDDRSRRLYFALLILCKFNRNNPVLNINKIPRTYSDKRFKIQISRQDIYKYANIKFKKEELSQINSPYTTLSSSGLIEAKWGKGRCTIILTKADTEPSSPYLTITNYNNFEEYYQYILNESNYKLCLKCGSAFKTSSSKNNDKLCPECKRSTDSYTYRHCVICGTRFKVKSKDNKSTKCAECQRVHKQNLDRERKNSALHCKVKSPQSL